MLLDPPAVLEIMEAVFGKIYTQRTPWRTLCTEQHSVARLHPHVV